MTRRVLVAYLVVVLAPLGALAFVSARLAGAEVERANDRVEELALASLRGVTRSLGELCVERRRRLLAALAEAPRDVEGFRDATRRLPGVAQGFWLDADGILVYPAPGGVLDRDEARFLRRTARIWTDGRLGAGGVEERRAAAPPKASAPPEAQYGAPQQQTSLAPLRKGAPSKEGSTVEPPRWHVWHEDDGLHVICFSREPGDGHVLGAELDRTALLADIVGELPDTDPELAHGRFRMLDAEGRVLHQWGGYAPAADERPLAREPLAAPLAAWTLEYFAAGAAAGSASMAAFASGAVPWLAGIAVLVVGLAVHVYRESTRELTEAAQRVSFVNQVSHELKTPLTNIRMYAELLEQQVEDGSEGGEAARYAAVITTESQRLSRLIGNVLTFGKGQRQELKLNRRVGIVDDVVARVLEHFRPSLESRKVAAETDLAAPAPCRFDPDALEQMLGNLLSNVEKYAAAGGIARVATRQEGERVTLTVADRGPGVPPADRDRIFEPFVRVSSSLTEGVSGAGIGLTIARELARLHGGDLRLLPERAGSCFEISLEVQSP